MNLIAVFLLTSLTEASFFTGIVDMGDRLLISPGLNIPVNFKE
jgi:hypothetical protein